MHKIVFLLFALLCFVAAESGLEYDQQFLAKLENNEDLELQLKNTIPNLSFFIYFASTKTMYLNGTVKYKGQVYPITSGAQLQLKVEGWAETFTITMNYFVPFGNMYHVQAKQSIVATTCAKIVELLTRANVQVRQGIVQDQGTVITSGTMEMDSLAVANSIFSMHAVNAQGMFDLTLNLQRYYHMYTQYMQDNCSAVVQHLYQNKMWIVWAYQGDNGFLLNMIKRPKSVEMRLALYNSKEGAKLFVQELPLDQFYSDYKMVRMGSVTLTHEMLNGTVGSYFLDHVQLNVQEQGMRFTPSYLDQSLPVFPNAYSFNTSTLVKGIVAGTVYQNASLGYHMYDFPIGLNYWQWCKISARQFAGYDLQVEIMALQLQNLWFVGSASVFYRGAYYQLDNPLSFDILITNWGGYVDHGGMRTFSVTIKASGLNIMMDCRTSDINFVELEQEGPTTVRTTTMGDCRVNDLISGAQFTNEGYKAMLENKY